MIEALLSMLNVAVEIAVIGVIFYVIFLVIVTIGQEHPEEDVIPTIEISASTPLEEVKSAIEYLESKQVEQIKIPVEEPPEIIDIQVKVEKPAKPAPKQKAMPKRGILDEEMKRELREKLMGLVDKRPTPEKNKRII